MNEPVFNFIMRVVIGAVTGGILGSFITMLVFRLPRGKSLINPPSSCPACRKKIEWRDMIPVYSYWNLKGKCRACGKPYGQRYFVIEVISTVFIALSILFYGFDVKAFTVMVIFTIVLTLAVIVMRQGREDS